MRVVNLAGRPFLNRRPVGRLALFLWLAGGVLLAVNLWLWGSHFQGSSVSAGRLDALDRQVAEEEKLLDEYWQQLRGIGLSGRNQRARYLNLLIHRRTFPWSRLFDELESVLPSNVYLENVQPNVHLAEETKKRVRSRRSVSAFEARRRARARARGEDSGDTAVDEPESATASAEPARDRVTLMLKGAARTEEAMFELVDRLYGHTSFLDPNLSRESTKSNQVDFNIKVTYLTPARETFPVHIEELPPEEAGDAEAAVEQQPRQTAEQTGPAAEGSATQDGGEAGSPALERHGRGFVQETLAARRQRSEARLSQQVKREQAQAAGEEGEAEVDSEQPQERAVVTRTGRPTPPGGASSDRGQRPSRVSVAPRRPGTSDAGRPLPDAAPGGEDSGTTEPRSEPSGAPRRPADRSVDRPEPAQPPASASPRLIGMLDLLPRFLRLETELYLGSGEAAS